MKARYVEPSIRISTTTTDRERISRWRRTRPSHDRSTRLNWDKSWRCHNSPACITATNGGPPEKTRVSTALSQLTLLKSPGLTQLHSSPCSHVNLPVTDLTIAGLDSSRGLLS